MIEYRPFRNSDPPELTRLWNTGGLGRGAVKDLAPDVLDLVNLSQPHFQREGLILAVENERAVGFIHAGFALKDDESGLEKKHGVICAAVVEPKSRRQGIGRELVRRAEEYLQNAGATTISAGPAPGRDPFYVGLYGGCQPAGFLDSDPAAAPFFQTLGYVPLARHLVYQREVTGPPEPVHFRLIGIRRKLEVVGSLQPLDMTWGWGARFGRLDTLEFLLCPKGKPGAETFARVTLMGLENYIGKWQQRAVGLAGLFVPEKDRRKGYGQALVLDICRKLRDEMIQCIDAHAEESNTAARGLLESCGFQQIDAGTEFVKANA